MGLAVRQTFLNAGLPDPDIQATVLMGGREAWEGYELVEATVGSLLPG